jgi:excisionase family DNA binding protein
MLVYTMGYSMTQPCQGAFQVSDARNWLTTDQVAEQLGTHPETIRRWARERKHLPFIRIGREARFEPRDVDAFLASARVEPVS